MLAQFGAVAPFAFVVVVMPTLGSSKVSSIIMVVMAATRLIAGRGNIIKT